jgi:hypothetical protein
MSISHRVVQGDCISSIAEKYGFFPDQIWNHPENSSLKQKRKSPDILYPGDIVKIPDLTEHQEPAATDTKHRFRRKGVPAILRLQILKEAEQDPQAAAGGKSTDESEYEAPDYEPFEREDEPVANAEYTFDAGGVKQEGTTDGEGRIEVKIPPGAETGWLHVIPESGDEMMLEVNLGAMDPIDTDSGLQLRLCNLGFSCEKEGETREAALRLFQEKYGLSVTGEPDQDTLDKLEEIHGR